ncbi:MAG: hypothetical protein IKA10_01515 [Oscillospiraceae bacterium]|nr:hypothetical protein [Oscillospiraceae bacterium]
MKVKDNTKLFTRICLAIILIAVVFLVYKLHFKGSDVDFISSINENYTITVEKEVTLIDNTDYKRLHVGDEFTTYQLTGDKAVEFKDVISSLKIRRLLRTSVSTKHVEDFVWYRITVVSDSGEKYTFSSHGDYMNIDDYTMFFCKPYGNWRDKLDAVLADAEIVEYYIQNSPYVNQS